MKINFFLRKKFPGYFSIEQLFMSLCAHLNKQKDWGIEAQSLEVPFYFSTLNFFRNIRFVKKNQAAINHITGDIHYAILGCSSKHVNILTIHDCVILERYGKWDPRYWIFRVFWYELPMRKADVITVISEKTRDDLHNQIGYGKSKIRVVNNFVPENFEYVPQSFNHAKPRFLFIGSTANKNLDRILSAISGIPCKLDIIGKISEQQEQFILAHGIEIELFYELSLEELFEKYKQADLVLFPSLYEAFGMLIIEAQAVGRPVVTSNISPMREIAGKGAALVDPMDVDSIKNGIEKVMHDNAYREMIIAEGLLNSKKFSLGDVAGVYGSIYREYYAKKN